MQQYAKSHLGMRTHYCLLWLCPVMNKSAWDTWIYPYVVPYTKSLQYVLISHMCRVLKLPINIWLDQSSKACSYPLWLFMPYVTENSCACPICINTGVVCQIMCCKFPCLYVNFNEVNAEYHTLNLSHLTSDVSSIYSYVICTMKQQGYYRGLSVSL